MGGGSTPASATLHRRRVGQDPTLPARTLLLGDGPVGLGPQAAEAPLTMAAQRFYHILHVAASSGEHEKVVQVTTLYLNLFSRGRGGVFPGPQTANRRQFG